MGWNHWLEEFKQFSPVTQVALVIFALLMVLLLVTYPTSGTSIITFLAALKILAGPVKKDQYDDERDSCFQTTVRSTEGSAVPMSKSN